MGLSNIIDAKKGLCAGLLALGLAASGCFRPGPATVPLRMVEIAEGSPGSHCLVVFLPGRGDTPEHFVRNDFPDELRRAGSRCAMAGVDAHLGYYFEKTIVDRLREDVIAPARAQGIEEIWLVGISLGGFGSLLYEMKHPGEIAGIVAIAPFLGDEKNEFQEFQAWLEGYGRTTRQPPLFLVYGTGDRFAEVNGKLAARLPDDHVFRVRGGHTWAAWRRGWGEFLKSRWVPGVNPGSAILSAGDDDDGSPPPFSPTRLR